MLTLYGIKNCDTVKKARRWLDDQGLSYIFHDVRADGLDAATVSAWIEQLGWESVMNKRSTSWKQLNDAQREAMNAEAATSAIVETPTLFKRPLLDRGGQFSVGCSAGAYETLFAN